MSALLALLVPLQALNDGLGRVGRVLAAAAIGLMVVVILVQVVARYGFNNALPWPDEAARFFMLWMTGLAAPIAYRQGGFVAVDLLASMLPNRIGALLSLVLLLLSLAVLIAAVQLGYKHTNSGWLFASSSLRLPLDLIGMKAVKLKLAWMYMSLLVGFVLLTLVNIELVLRSLVRLLGGDERLRPIPIMVGDG